MTSPLPNEGHTMETYEDGTLPAYSFPGCYPYRYLTRDGLSVCPACANQTDTSDPVQGQYVVWEGAAEPCDDCGDAMPTAYGEEDEA